MSVRTITETKSRVLRARDAYHVLTVVLAAWAKSCVDAMSTSSTRFGLVNDEYADVSYGTAREDSWSGPRLVNNDAESDSSKWVAAPSRRTARHDTSARSNLVGNVMVAEGETIGTWILITLDAAARWLENECRRVALSAKVRAQNQVVSNRTGRFRAWMHWNRCQAEMETHLVWGFELLKSACLTQSRRPRGPQIIQTRRPIKARYYRVFTFCGKPAVMLPPGRVPLTRTEWLKRYHARRDRRRKTARRRRKDKRTLKVPMTKHGRPNRMIAQLIADWKKPRRQLPMFSYADDFDADDILREFRAALA